MEEEIKRKLREFIEKEYQIIARPEDILNQAIGVIEFFKKYEKEEEPYAVNEINALEDALDYLYSQQ